ncbi:MAG: glycoside hydrolase family 2 TIM barrel-domain containing protein [Mucilaginibacter sp.]|uniref:glycoside hydrolase family 2 protein n=1 Tax=Mucilaginibacter sp. TaxID=1882438 RepID=UPI0031A98BFE
MKKIPLCFLLIMGCLFQLKAQTTTSTSNFNNNWEFVKDIDTSNSGYLLSSTAKGSANWEKISLPHTANIEPVEKVKEQWQGTCFYRKFFIVPLANKGKHIALQFDAAMHEADVYLNGKHIYKHLGGFLPFYIDISNTVLLGKQNVILVKLNNQDNAVIPPAKPIKDLDFNYYGGIYRNAWLIIKNKLYISNAVQAGRVAGGGVLIHDAEVSEKEATLVVKTDINNDFNLQKKAQVKITLTDKNGKVVSSSVSNDQVIEPNAFESFTQNIKVNNPMLWSPGSPYLYRMRIQVIQDGKTVDEQIINTGIKTFKFEAGGFYLNGKKYPIVGTNRHQEYPYIGYALSDNAQYRDAFKIKEAGFNFVRCSHYPPSPAYLDACDQLGILVMDAIPGWQFFGNQEFQENSFQNIRDMVRRDRNHAAIVLWEASLNETDMSEAYMDAAHKIVHEELPFTDVFTTGWKDYAFEVFNPARQHMKAPDYWKKYDKNKPLLIAEYGDWEYYAQNAGFNQTEYQNLTKEEKSSRQLRGYGQERLLQQSLNFQEAHNDNFNGNIVGDVNWLMFDYKRGYATDLETSGVMDIFRVPKFSYYFFQSQRDVKDSKPMLFIANYWNDPADNTVKVYSNCSDVELKLNGKVIARQKPDTGKNVNNLAHPPFTFHVPRYEPGALQATGFIYGKSVATYTSTTPGKPYKIVLKADYSGKPLKAGCNDAVFVYAYIVDNKGVTVPVATNSVRFSVNGGAGIIGDKDIKAEAGITPTLVMGGDKIGNITVKADADGLMPGELSLQLK